MLLSSYFRQLTASWTLRFIFDHPLKQRSNGRQVEKKGKTRMQKFEYLRAFFIVFEGLSFGEKKKKKKKNDENLTQVLSFEPGFSSISLLCLAAKE